MPQRLRVAGPHLLQGDVGEGPQHAAAGMVVAVLRLVPVAARRRRRDAPEGVVRDDSNVAISERARPDLRLQQGAPEGLRAEQPNGDGHLTRSRTWAALESLPARRTPICPRGSCTRTGRGQSGAVVHRDWQGGDSRPGTTAVAVTHTEYTSNDVPS